VVEELKDPSKRQIQSKPQNELDTVTKTLDVDEADYEPTQNGGMTVLVGGEEDSGTMPMAQREVILKEIAAFRDRSNRRERNKTWIEEEEKGRNERDNSPMQSEPRRRDRNTENEEKRAAKAGSAQDNIPSGPAADRRKARDYHQSVKFRSSSDRYERDEDDDMPDDELERRRLERKRRDLETNFVDVWLPILASAHC
jgi:RNA-binding protein 25